MGLKATQHTGRDKALDLAFDTAAMQLQLAVTLFTQGLDAAADRKLVGQRTAQQHQRQ